LAHLSEEGKRDARAGGCIQPYGSAGGEAHYRYFQI
jgi:hypothetical protein